MGRIKIKRQTREERLSLKRQAERKRYERIKNDPHLFELQRIKERQKYLRKKQNRKVMSIKDMTPEEQKKQRKLWRHYSYHSYRKKRVHAADVRMYSVENDVKMDSEDTLESTKMSVKTRSRSNSIESFTLFDSIKEDPFADCPSTPECDNLLAEFQANEEEEFGAAVRARQSAANTSTTTRGVAVKPAIRVAASAPPPLPPSAHPMLWPEDAVPRIRPGINADECQIFGDFVASELRTLRSDELRKRLKRMIQKAILQIGEEEDVSMING